MESISMKGLLEKVMEQVISISEPAYLTHPGLQHLGCGVVGRLSELTNC